ncbi:MAG: hypothetical protein UW30_C0001G0009 [Candidatus Giovannonibacteria bacterium GW2011_GWA2_44_13b]|uniref:Peptidase S8/S53 domain-containing protein n=2 Tax=Candidatus Giovannoniibacteriota TaxID=1752738 RepID=A0A0G1K399_9BACT|nr:MAG: hypothetical protein UW30_C0001G0009 [Candidatus Giovannonibacteria bacterium GW2011_GWA2_44_13b]OGF83100.1 MAG: hypothetical protein A2924_03890 [Candidatus Giovannonibacteria bacterium RIFCSPLOWO2_01_FULL_44_16]
MKNIKTAIALFALLALSVSAADGAKRKIVTFAPNVSAEQGNEAIKIRGGVKINDLDFIHAKVAYLTENAAKELAKENSVLRVEDDAVVTIQAKGGGEVSTLAQILPWGVKRVKADLVWDSGNNANFVKVGVIDTGISTSHPDLVANIKGGQNYVKLKGMIDPTKWNDDNGHGSHVAGIIAALNNTSGVVGVAPQADLYAIKVLDRNGSGYTSDVISGIGWAVSNGIQVINMSLGCACDTVALHNAVINAVNNGVVVVAAAGNSATSPVIYPAAYPEVIAVSATDSNDNLASWSARGPEIDVSAPGVSIYSTYKGTSYKTLSGTSMASPHVAGSAALVLSTPVGLNDANLNGVWDPPEVQSKLQSTVTDLGAVGFDNLFGWGLINAWAAVQ